jgi:cyclic lactone autoinducer peptide
MKKRILTMTATVATAVAAMVASSACLLFFYQPEEPKSLREE